MQPGALLLALGRTARREARDKRGRNHQLLEPRHRLLRAHGGGNGCTTWRSSTTCARSSGTDWTAAIRLTDAP